MRSISKPLQAFLSFFAATLSVLVIFQTRSFTSFNNIQANNVNILQDTQHSVEAFVQTLPTNEKVVAFKSGNERKKKRNANPHTVETMEHLTSTVLPRTPEKIMPENADNSIRDPSYEKISEIYETRRSGKRSSEQSKLHLELREKSTLHLDLPYVPSKNNIEADSKIRVDTDPESKYSTALQNTSKVIVTSVHEGLNVEGEIDPSKNYVITAASIPRSAEQLKYIFYLPITGSVWKEQGFLPIVVLTGRMHEWDRPNSPAKLARDGVRNIPGAIIVYLESTEEHEVTMAQVSRLFAGGNFFSDPKYDDTYFITTDVDLWPLNIKNHTLPADKDIIITRTLSGLKGCCMRSIALSCVGMRGKTWREVMNLEDCPAMQKSALDWEEDALYPAFPQISPLKGYIKWCLSKPAPSGSELSEKAIIDKQIYDENKRRISTIKKGMTAPTANLLITSNMTKHEIAKLNAENSMNFDPESMYDKLVRQNNGNSVKNETILLNYLGNFFEQDVAHKEVRRDEMDMSADQVARKTWFIDQSLITKLVAAWVERKGGYPNGYNRVEYGTKKINRLDRGRVWVNVMAMAGLGDKAEIFAKKSNKQMNSTGLPEGVFDKETGKVHMEVFQDAHLPGGKIYFDSSFDSDLYPFLQLVLKPDVVTSMVEYQREFFKKSEIWASEMEISGSLRKRKRRQSPKM